jgi:Flp pilus assembly protein TadD
LDVMGRAAEAIAPLLRAVALEPARPEFRNALGNALRELGQLDAAKEEYLAASRLDPDCATFRFNLGLVFLDRGEPAKAIAAFRKAVELDRSDGGAHQSLGVTLYQLGRMREAVPVLRKAVDLRPDDGETHFTLGAALERMRDHRAALPVYRRASELGWTEAAGAVRACELRLALEARLPGILAGSDDARDAVELLALAYLCQERGQWPQAAVFWTRVLDGGAAPPSNWLNHPHFSGALVAARLGFGGPEDPGLPSDPAAAQWRERARVWLQTELEITAGLLAKATPLERVHLGRFIDEWRGTGLLAGMREAQRLALLPDVERAALAALWRSLDELRDRVNQER